MSFSAIERVLERLQNDPASTCDLVEMRAPLADGKAFAHLRRISSETLSDLSALVDRCARLRDYPKHFPRLYDHRLVRERMVLELLLEHCEPGSLDKVMAERRKFFSSKRAQYFVDNMLRALCILHGLGIAHGSITPRSVLVEGVKRFKLDAYCLTDSTPNFAQDVFDLGLTFLRFFAMDASLQWRGDVNQLIERKLGAYGGSFGDTVSTLLKRMLSEDPRARPSAEHLLSCFRSVPFESLQPSLLPSSLGSVVSSRLKTLSVQVPDEANLSEEKSMSSGQSIQSSAIAKPSPVQPQPGSLHFIQGLADEFELLLSGVCTAMEVRVTEESVLRSKIQPLMAKLQLFGGDVECKVSIAFFACDACKEKKYASERTIIPICNHAFCRDCYNASITLSLTSSCRSSLSILLVVTNLGRYSPLPRSSGIVCPIDSVPFKPFSSPHLNQNLYNDVRKLLDSILIQKSSIICPKCNMKYVWDNSGLPVEIKCPMCKKTFCSYCRENSHSYNCSLWDRNRRNQDSLQQYDSRA